jgi:hypothetical protein
MAGSIPIDEDIFPIPTIAGVRMVIGVDARSNVITHKLARVATNIPSSEGLAHRNPTTVVTILHHYPQ